MPPLFLWSCFEAKLAIARLLAEAETTEQFIIYSKTKNGGEPTHNPCTFDKKVYGITWQDGH